MVLAPAQARKGQSGSRFAQEDMTAGVGLAFGLQSTQYLVPSKEVSTRHWILGTGHFFYFASVTCSLFSSYTPNFLAIGFSVG
jgi:hypothetical protein